MVKKKIISKEKSVEMKGFEEIMDLVVNEHEKIEVEKKQREADQINDSYHLYNFLEEESERLEKLSKFFGTKVNNFKEFNQTKHILDKQSSHTVKMKDDLAQYQLSSNSPLNHHLSKLFDSLF